MLFNDNTLLLYILNFFVSDMKFSRPFWLSPRQAIVLPIGPSCVEYAETVKKRVFEAGFNVDIESDPGLTINKKVRNAQVAQYNFILVVGKWIRLRWIEHFL